MAIRELLSRPLAFGGPAGVKRFQSWCRFVLAESTRLARVRDLSLYFEEVDWRTPEAESYLEEGDEDDEDDVAEYAVRRSVREQETSRRRGKLLLEVLRRATRLRKLSVMWDEGVLYADPEVASAISRLPALKSFEVEPYSRDAQHSVTDVLASMVSRLEFLSLQYVTYYDAEAEVEEGVWDYDLPRALAPHLGHLQELRLSSPYGRTPNIRCPTLRTLRIPMGKKQPRPRELFEAFPNLRNLVFLADGTDHDPFLHVMEHRFAALRDSRISEQRDGHIWSSLDTIRGELTRLYVFGLTCPVRRPQMTEYPSERPRRCRGAGKERHTSKARHWPQLYEGA